MRDAAHHNQYGRSWCPIVVVRGQMELHAVTRDAQVHRPVALAILVV